MTREELEKMLESYIPNTGGDWKEAIVDAMVGAYNRALEDVYGRLCNSSKSYVLKYLETKLNID